MGSMPALQVKMNFTIKPRKEHLREPNVNKKEPTGQQHAQQSKGEAGCKETRSGWEGRTII